MCDYSLENLKSRPARIGDRLQSARFKDSITHGFRGASDNCNEAVCLLPGTELAFDEPIQSSVKYNTNVAKFIQIDIDNPYAHHDALELVSGAIVKVHDLIEGQICNVLQLPVSEPVTDPIVEEAANNYFESLMSA